MAEKMEGVETQSVEQQGPTAEQVTACTFTPIRLVNMKLTRPSYHSELQPSRAGRISIRRSIHTTSTAIDIEHPQKPSFRRSPVERHKLPLRPLPRYSIEEVFVNSFGIVKGGLVERRFFTEDSHG